ncbi:MAG: sulfotransferase family protein [Candidatus Binatia bacterium]
MENSNGWPVCIIGMHRSGTSMVANLLRLHGLSLGPDEHLMGASESNQFGHFEHTGFLEINEALLKYLGGSWDSPPKLQSDWEQDPGLDDLARKASVLLQDFAACKHWGWKDPRTTILLPFWRRIVPNLRYVICIRSPLEVAWSLAQRDGQSITAAAHLWRQYTCQAIRSTEGYSRILTFYEDYFCRPTQEANRLSEFCGLRNATGVSPIEASIAAELRHQVGGVEELLNEPSISIEDKLLYFMLRALPLPGPLATPKDYITGTNVPDGMGSVLRLIAELHGQDKTLQLESAVGEKEQQLHALRAVMREESRRKDETIAQLQDRNARLQTFTDAVRQTLAYRLYRTLLKPFRDSQGSP